jgi:hypothetical protein
VKEYGARRDHAAREGRKHPTLDIDCAKFGMLEEDAVDMDTIVDDDLLPGESRYGLDQRTRTALA